MKIEEVKILIEAFYNGETTAVEEQALLHYFEGDNIPDELEVEREVFLQLSNARPVDVPIGLEAKLNNLIDVLAENELKEKIVVPIAPSVKINNRHLLWMRIAGVAASVAILFSVGLFINNNNDNVDPSIQLSQQIQLKDTYEDPDQAYREAEKALLLVSSNLNKGVSRMSVVSENIDKSKTILDKSVNRINFKDL